MTAIALGFTFGNPLAQVSGYLLGLVMVDFGMTAVAVLAWMIGKPLWREVADPRYLAIAIGFAGLPVWGVLDTVCVVSIIPEFSRSVVCAVTPDLSWVPVLWLLALPVASVFYDFLVYLRSPDASAGHRLV